MIKELSDKDHILLRPAMYIGSVTSTKSQEYIIDGNAINLKEIEYVPGLIKIINEIIDNSVDVAIKNDFKVSNQISVKMTSNTVTIQDNGTGIPVKKNDDGLYFPYLCFGKSRAGSNFDDDVNRTQIGMNGVGSFATNCFSKNFIAVTDDGENRYKVHFKDNQESFKEWVTPSGKKTGTVVEFEPDLARFGLSEIDETHMNVIQQRLLNLSLSFPEIDFKFNGKKVKANSFKKYAQMFHEKAEIFESKNCNFKFAILPNAEDDFRQFSYVNGLKIPDGGTHVDVITQNVVNRIRDKLVRKYKSIKPADIRNKLMVIVFIQNLKNTKFNSQAKEKITNSHGEINAFFDSDGGVDFDKFANQVLRSKDIIDPITEIYRIKEEFKKRQDLKALNKPKTKIRSEKYLPPIGKQKYLFLVEGECLEENTEVTMSDFSTKKIKDINEGDKILGGNLETHTVLAKNKLLKECIEFKTKSGSFICGKKHRLYVYNTSTKDFCYTEAQDIKLSTDIYKLVRSKVNNTTQGLEVSENDIISSKITAGKYFIDYTDNDYFIILRDGKVEKQHASNIIVKDVIMMVED